MSKRIVFSLPIVPRKDPVAGYFALPVVIDLYAQLCSLYSAFGLNTIGSSNQNASWYKSSCNQLGIKFHEFFTDEEVILGTGLNQSAFETGVREKWIVEEEVSIYLCECGKTEFLHHSEEIDCYGRRVYDLNDELHPVCRLCSSEAKLIQKKAWVLKIPLQSLANFSPKFYPKYLEKDFCEILSFYRGKSILLSRSTPKETSAIIEGEKTFLDNDFSWMLWPAMLASKGYHLDTFVFGCRATRQVVMSLIMTELLGINLPQALINTPYLRINVKDPTQEKMRYLLSHHNPLVIRSLLSLSLGASKKEMVLNSSLLHQIEEALSFDGGCISANSANSYSSIDVCKMFTREGILRCILSLKKRKISLSQSERFLLDTILQ